MADVKISALPGATPSNTSILPAVVGGITSQVTTVQIINSVVNASPLTISQGGTGANTASTARTSLGLGTLSTQNSTTVAIGGGNIDSTIIGASTAANATFINMTATNGVYAKGNDTTTYTDGTVLDYLSGQGRISVGGNDGIGFYNNGVANVSLGNVTSAAVWNLPNIVSANAVITGGTISSAALPADVYAEMYDVIGDDVIIDLSNTTPTTGIIVPLNHAGPVSATGITASTSTSLFTISAAGTYKVSYSVVAIMPDTTGESPYTFTFYVADGVNISNTYTYMQSVPLDGFPASVSTTSLFTVSSAPVNIGLYVSASSADVDTKFTILSCNVLVKKVG